jgi:hypothetical protein
VLELVTGPMTGQQYLDSLRDGREIYIYGERVEDVTTHRAFRNASRSIARLYDALHDAKHKATLLATDRQGILTHKFFKPSYSAQELMEAREAIVSWARFSYGFMGARPTTRRRSWRPSAQRLTSTTPTPRTRPGGTARVVHLGPNDVRRVTLQCSLRSTTAAVGVGLSALARRHRSRRGARRLSSCPNCGTARSVLVSPSRT